MVVNVAEGVRDIRSLTYRSGVVISCLRDSSAPTITAENVINVLLSVLHPPLGHPPII